MKKTKSILLMFLILMLMTGCNSSSEPQGQMDCAKPSGGYTEEQLIQAFMDRGYSVSKEDVIAEDLGYSSSEVNVIGIGFERDNDGLSDFGDLLYAEFTDTVGSIQFYRRMIDRLEDDDYTFDEQSGDDWDYASGTNEGQYWYYNSMDNGYIVARNGKFVILMFAGWEDYLDEDEPFDYLPMIITEGLCR